MKEVMDKIKNYSCYKDKDIELTDDLISEYSLNFPQAYQCKEEMLKYSVFIKEMTKNPYYILPFCSTLEAEAMGGRVNFGDRKIGPRPGEPILEKIDQVMGLSDIDFTKGRIKETLDAVKDLEKQGYPLIFEISGPVSILNALVDSKEIFMAMRKDREILIKAYGKIGKNLLAYINELVERGVDIISFADPATSVDILGDKMMIQYIDDFLLGFLKKAAGKLGPASLIHLCPKLTLGLVGSGRADFVSIPVDPSLSYAQAFKEALGKEKILGSRCIKAFDSNMKKGSLEAIRLG